MASWSSSRGLCQALPPPLLLAAWKLHMENTNTCLYRRVILSQSEKMTDDDRGGLCNKTPLQFSSGGWVVLLDSYLKLVWIFSNLVRVDTLVCLCTRSCHKCKQTGDVTAISLNTVNKWLADDSLLIPQANLFQALLVAFIYTQRGRNERENYASKLYMSSTTSYY